jgi:hypothetical protein
MLQGNKINYYSDKFLQLDLVHLSHNFPEAYERLENIVKTYPADRLNLLNTNTEFLIKSEESSNGALIITPPMWLM